MTKSLKDRLQESIDVSGAFDNCFFHTYAAHLITNGVDLPEKLFNFESILGEESHASKLQQLFPSQEALDLFAEYHDLKDSEDEPLSSEFLVEKTLVLGFMMREWFATEMANDTTVRDDMIDKVVESFNGYKEFRAFSDKEALLSGAEGVLYQANENFLEYFYARPKVGILTAEEKRFEAYFTDTETVDDAIKAFFKAEGYQNYCRQFANPKTKLAHNDIMPMMKQLEQPIIIYDGNQTITAKHEVESELPVMEVKLDALAGHYHLLQTEDTSELLQGYALSYAQYKIDREAILSAVDKEEEASKSKSMFVQAICPTGHLEKDPSTYLIEKATVMTNAVSKAHEASFEESKDEALKIVQLDGLRLEEVNSSIIFKYPEIALAAVNQNPEALEHAAKHHFILNKLDKFEEVAIAAVSKNGQTLSFINNTPLRYQNPESYKAIALAAVKNDGMALIHVHRDYIEEHMDDYLEIVQAAVEQNGLAFSRINQQVFQKHQNTKPLNDIFLAAVKQNGMVFEQIAPKITSGRGDYIEVVKEATNENPMSLEFANLTTIYPIMRHKGEFGDMALKAVQKDGRAFQFIAKTSLLHDDVETYKSVALAAVKQNGLALAHVHRDFVENHLEDYKEVVEAAVSQNPEAQKHVNEQLYLNSSNPEIKQRAQKAASKYRSVIEHMTIDDLIKAVKPKTESSEVQIGLETDKLALVAGEHTPSVHEDLGQLALTELPVDAQYAIVQYIATTLSDSSSNISQTPVGQIFQLVSKNAEDIMSGRKTHFSIMYQDDKGLVQSVHLAISDLLNKPGTIVNILSALYNPELSEMPQVHMGIHTAIEVAALLQIQGTTLASLGQQNIKALTNTVVQNANDLHALNRIAGEPFDESTFLKDAQTLVAANTDQSPIKSADVLTILKEILTLYMAGQEMILEAPKVTKDDEHEAVVIEDVTTEPEQPKTKPKKAKVEQPVTEPKKAKVEQPVTEPKKAKVEQPVTEPKKAKVKQPVTEPKKAKVEQPVTEPKKAKVEQPVTEPKKAKVEQPVTEPKKAKVEQPSKEPKKTPEEIRAQKYQAAQLQIEDILNEFKSKIDSEIGGHSSSAKTAALNLHQQLTQLKNEAFQSPSKESLDEFVKHTKQSIKEATPQLQRDLGWGSYLQNLAKQIVNVILNVVSFGLSGSSFFKTQTSKAVETARKVEEDIEQATNTSSLRHD